MDSTHFLSGSFASPGKTYSAELIGQQFDDPKYFWGRHSAIGAFAYNAFNADNLTASSESNYGPLHPTLLEMVPAGVDVLKVADPDNTLSIPGDLATASVSGLDPHISLPAALYQVHRVAQTRGLSDEAMRDLVNQYTKVVSLASWVGRE